MAKRHNFYKGSYVQHSRNCSRYGRSNNQMINIQNYIGKLTDYLRKVYSIMNESYVTIFTILLVGLLSFLLPDMLNKIHKTNELKAMKNAVDLMAEEVTKAEVACLTVANDLCYLQCSMRDDETETSANLRDLSVCTNDCVRDTRSEPVQIEKKVGLFRRIFFPNGKTSHREIAIMSFVYSDSFTDHKAMNNTIDPSVLDLKIFNDE